MTSPNTVRIRVAPYVWLNPMALAVLNAVTTLRIDRRADLWFAWLHSALIALLFALGLVARGFGVDLTADHALVRGLRRRRVDWNDVLAVAPYEQAGSWRLRLHLRDDTTINLRAPSTVFGLGCKRYERDYHRIGQWWQGHSVNATAPAP